MFRYAADELKRAEQDGKPVFIMLLSITNHPPYQLPAPHQRQNFHLTAQEQSRLSSLAQGDTLNEVFNTYKYSNDQLGNFISQVKQNSPHTIIAATGDHNMRAISYPNPQDTALGHGVPFYLYVPPEYRTQAQYQPQRAGSHKDIVPRCTRSAYRKLSITKQAATSPPPAKMPPTHSAATATTPKSSSPTTAFTTPKTSNTAHGKTATP